ncbi:hypothetical protein H696_04019 [Fonticula alba]|uniref:Ras-GEF domain-containing protein n=1 Tax=Fonticula alba TaxID=691883 RepID=A0A058Z5P3_FONAL|nr:hypothetical protein H696_04019 [Fonticula alba]KCV69599.1 hypothetical protein H696_04019 [Fonticula alba]|eukprot:XP_009496164.1 hypothetical protein H696_04019 [Fonticula alba]
MIIPCDWQPSDLHSPRPRRAVQHPKLSSEAGVFLSGVIEYLAMDIIKLAGYYTLNDRRRSITDSDIHETVFIDPDLRALLRRANGAFYFRNCVSTLSRCHSDLVLLQKYFGETLRVLKSDIDSLPAFFRGSIEPLMIAVEEIIRQIRDMRPGADALPFLCKAIDLLVSISPQILDYAQKAMNLYTRLPIWLEQPSVKHLFSERKMLSSAYHHLGWLLLIPLRSTIYCHSMLERLFFNFFRSETPFIDHLEKARDASQAVLRMSDAFGIPLVPGSDRPYAGSYSSLISSNSAAVASGSVEAASSPFWLLAESAFAADDPRYAYWLITTSRDYIRRVAGWPSTGATPASRLHGALAAGIPRILFDCVLSTYELYPLSPSGPASTAANALPASLQGAHLALAGAGAGLEAGMAGVETPVRSSDPLVEGVLAGFQALRGGSGGGLTDPLPPGFLDFPAPEDPSQQPALQAELVQAQGPPHEYMTDVLCQIPAYDPAQLPGYNAAPAPSTRRSRKCKDRLLVVLDRHIIISKQLLVPPSAGGTWAPLALGGGGGPHTGTVAAPRDIAGALYMIFNLMSVSIREGGAVDDHRSYIELIHNEPPYGGFLLCLRDAETHRSVYAGLLRAQTAYHLAVARSRLRAHRSLTTHLFLLPSMRLSMDAYKFAIPDTSDNIIFEVLLPNDNAALTAAAAMIDLSSEESWSGAAVQDSPQIRAASVAKLVEHLTHERYNNPHFIGEFLLTYRSFTEPGTLLRLLTERYYMPEPTSPDLTPEDLAYFRSRIKQPVQRRVKNVIKNWVDKYYSYDFMFAPELTEQLLLFVADIAKAEGAEREMRHMTAGANSAVDSTGALLSPSPTGSLPLAQVSTTSSGEVPRTFFETISSLIERRRLEFEATSPVADPSELTALSLLAGMWRSPVAVTNLLLARDPHEVALALTLYDSRLFCRIRSLECQNQGWVKRRPAEGGSFASAPADECAPDAASPAAAAAATTTTTTAAAAAAAAPPATVAGTSTTSDTAFTATVDAHPASPLALLRDAPNIHALTLRFNRTAGWVKTLILGVPDAQKRAEVLERFILIAERCFRLNNFHATMAMVSAINSSSIRRLRNTWALVSQRARTILSDLQKIVHTERSYATYRRLLHTAHPPRVPYFGVYQSDLTFIEDGNPDLIPGTALVNFSKRRRLAQVIWEIQTYQQQVGGYEQKAEALFGSAGLGPGRPGSPTTGMVLTAGPGAGLPRSESLHDSASLGGAVATVGGTASSVASPSSGSGGAATASAAAATAATAASSATAATTAGGGAAASTTAAAPSVVQAEIQLLLVIAQNLEPAEDDDFCYEQSLRLEPRDPSAGAPPAPAPAPAIDHQQPASGLPGGHADSATSSGSGGGGSGGVPDDVAPGRTRAASTETTTDTVPASGATADPGVDLEGDLLATSGSTDSVQSVTSPSTTKSLVGSAKHRHVGSVLSSAQPTHSPGGTSPVVSRPPSSLSTHSRVVSTWKRGITNLYESIRDSGSHERQRELSSTTASEAAGHRLYGLRRPSTEAADTVRPRSQSTRPGLTANNSGTRMSSSPVGGSSLAGSAGASISVGDLSQHHSTAAPGSTVRLAITTDTPPSRVSSREQTPSPTSWSPLHAQNAEQQAAQQQQQAAADEYFLHRGYSSNESLSPTLSVSHNSSVSSLGGSHHRARSQSTNEVPLQLLAPVGNIERDLSPDSLVALQDSSDPRSSRALRRSHTFNSLSVVGPSSGPGSELSASSTDHAGSAPYTPTRKGSLALHDDDRHASPVVSGGLDLSGDMLTPDILTGSPMASAAQASRLARASASPSGRRLPPRGSVMLHPEQF